MKALFTHNLAAKVVSLALAILLWMVIRKSQLSEPVTSQPKNRNIEFGAAAYGEKK
jgi:YbbR domain-containing protein